MQPIFRPNSIWEVIERAMASCIQIRLVNGFKRYHLVFVLQVLIDKHGVVTLFLSLNFIPVGKAVKPDFLEIV